VSTSDATGRRGRLFGESVLGDLSYALIDPRIQYT